MYQANPTPQKRATMTDHQPVIRLEGAVERVTFHSEESGFFCDPGEVQGAAGSGNHDREYAVHYRWGIC